MIRRAVPADLEVVMEMVGEFYEINGHSFEPDVVRGALLSLLESDQHGIVVVSEAQGIDGYALLTWSFSLESGGRDGLLDEIYVRDREMGVGKALMGAVFEEMRSRALDRIYLETEAPNESARSFYRSLGFEVDDSVWMSMLVPKVAP